VAASAGITRTLIYGRRATRISRAAFLSGVSAILGANQRLIYTPNGSDTTTSVESSSAGRTITWDATIAARVARLGNGWYQTFNGTTQYGIAPDTADLSFGNGTVDTPFSCFVVANVTSAAGARTFLAKSDAANQEYLFGVNGNFLNYGQFDQSIPSTPTRGSNATITRGSWQTFSSTYSAATGGATAMNDVTFYGNGNVLASTAFNDAGYVAMEGLAAGLSIGARTAGTAEFYTGSLALVCLTQKLLTAAEHLAIKALCNKYFGLKL
jgi:hypothetical protein